MLPRRTASFYWFSGTYTAAAISTATADCERQTPLRAMAKGRYMLPSAGYDFVDVVSRYHSTLLYAF